MPCLGQVFIHPIPVLLRTPYFHIHFNTCVSSKSKMIGIGKIFPVFLFILISGNPGKCQSKQSLESLASDGQAVADQSAAFSSKLYRAATTSLSSENGNFLLSPFSLSSVLSMLREGAEGSTKQELSQTLSLDSLKDPVISSGFRDILSSLHENRGSLVKIANRLYISNSAKLNATFSDLLQSFYYTKVLPVNFEKSQEVVEDTNAWVKDATNGKIRNIVSPDSIDRDTKAIAANAIYFKGKWVKDFNVRATRELLFTSEDGRSSPSLFMEQEDVFPFADLQEIDASAIGMPYVGDRFSLIVILPHSGKNLSQVESKLQKWDNFFHEIPTKMMKKSLQLVFPKFKTEFEIDFTSSGILKMIGLKDSLTPGGANFSPISKDEKLHIDKVLQKCYIDITEFGTEAAGATHVKIVPLSIRRSLPFEVTRPFLAYIYDKVTQTVLFVLRKTSV